MFQARTNRAFTLIELLVVVTIIVVLLALLVPAMEKAIEQAERVVCASRLKVWGEGHAQYYFDNQRKLLDAPTPTTRGAGELGLLPSHPRPRREAGGDGGGEFTLDSIAPYVQGPNDGPNDSATYVGEVWYCPSSIDGFWYKNNHDKMARGEELYLLSNDYGTIMYNDYAYFGTVGSKLRGNATHPDKLVGRSLGEGKVLMTDTLYRLNSGPSRWWFNHSDAGYSMHEFDFNEYVHQGIPPTGLGINQVFGDASVHWKGESHFDPAAMELRDPALDWTSNGSGPNPGGNVSFY